MFSRAELAKILNCPRKSDFANSKEKSKYKNCRGKSQWRGEVFERGNTRRVQVNTYKLQEGRQVWSNDYKWNAKGKTSTDKGDRAFYFGTRSAYSSNFMRP